MRWFPERKWEFAGDGGYGTHEFARFAYRHRRRLTLVSKFPKDADLYHPAPIRTSGTNGRPRSKDKPMAKPETVVARMRKKKLNVTWYGGGTRLVEYVTGVGHWFKSGVRLVPIRWVYVRDSSSNVLNVTQRLGWFRTQFSMDCDRILAENLCGFGMRRFMNLI